MPLPGGASDKIGNRYERRWTTYCMIKVMSGKFDSIFLEPFDEEKAEFLLKQGEKREYHQAKRQLVEGNWTLAKLSAEGILQELAPSTAEFDANWVFISGHPAPELRELSERAKPVSDWQTFSQVSLQSNKWSREFYSLKEHWQRSSDEETFEALKRITIITIDEPRLHELSLALLYRFFEDTVAENVISVLKEYAEDNIHVVLTTENILEHLSKRGFQPHVSPKNVVSTESTIHPSMSIIEQTLRDDIQILSDRLSQEIDAKLKAIDRARKEGTKDGLLEQIAGLRSDTYSWLCLTSEQQAEALCIEAALVSEVKNDLEAALQLAEEAGAIAQIPRVKRMKAHIAAYGKGDWEKALLILAEEQDIDSINLRAAILAEIGEIQQAKLLLENENEPTADTFQTLAYIYIKELGLTAARINIEAAIAREPTWLRAKFLRGVIEYLSAFSQVALQDAISSWPWPVPVQHSLVKLDHESLQSIRAARKFFEELMSIEPQSEVGSASLWYLASLVYDPESEKEALACCVNLLNLDTTHLLTVTWAQFLDISGVLEPVKTNLQSMVQNGEATSNHKLVLADIYHHLGENENLLRFLKDIEIECRQAELALGWSLNYARALLANDEYETVEQFIQEVELEQNDTAFILQGLLLEYKAQQTADFDPLIEYLEKRYNDTRSDLDLLSYCQVLHRTGSWETLADLLHTLRSHIDTSSVNWMAIQATYETDNYQSCLDLLEDYLKRFFPIVSLGYLADIRAACLEELGRVNEAIVVLEEVVKREPTEHRFHNLAHLYRIVGDTARLVVVAQQFLDSNFYQLDALIGLADLLQGYHPEIAARLVRRALEHELPEEAMVRIWMLAEQLGLYAEARELFSQMIALAEQGRGGLQPVTPGDFFSLNRTSRQKAIDLWGEYLKGTIPVHMYTDELNIPLITQYYFNFRSSVDDIFLSRQTAILARHGGRQITHASSPEEVSGIRLYADLTAILIAANLNVLGQIEDVFSPISIPQQLIPALEEMIRSLTEKQPEIVAAKKMVLDHLADGSISVVDTSQIVTSRETEILQEELRESQVVLLHMARENNGFYVDFLPIQKLTRAAEVRLAVIPAPWTEYVIGRDSVAESLRKLGEITIREYQSAAAILEDKDEATLVVHLDAKTNLYFDSNAIETLAQARILSAACRNFHLYISRSYEAHLRDELAWREHATEMILWLQQLIRRLNQGVQAGTYKFIANPRKSRLFQFGENTQCILALLEIPHVPSGVIWIDDRLGNSASFANLSTIGINDVLHALLSIKKIEPEDYYEYLIKLRAANVRYIPLESDELLYHLRHAVVAGDFVETPELRILRRYFASCMQYPNDLQYPSALPANTLNKLGEIAFIGSLKLNVHRIFSQIWGTVDDPVTRRLFADWVLNNLFLDYMALVESANGSLVSFLDHRLAPDLAALALRFWGLFGEHEIKNENLTDLAADFSDWVWNGVLEPYVRVNSGLLSQVVESVKLLFAAAKESAQQVIEDQNQRNIVLHQIYLSLPEIIRQELNKDTGFLESAGIEVISVIYVNDIQFDANEFWKGVSNAWNEGTASVETLTRDTRYELEATYRDDEKVIVVSNSSDEQLNQLLVRHAGVLSDKAEEQANDLASKRYFLDCCDAEFNSLVRGVAKAPGPSSRIRLVEDYLGTSSTVQYSNMLERLQGLQPGNEIGLAELLPPSLEGLRRHLRLPKQSDSFAEAYARAAETLLSEESLLVAIQRLVCLPVPLPDMVLDHFKSLDRSEQGKILKLFISNKSPVSTMHWLTLLALSEDQAAVEQLISVLLSEVNYQYLLAFQSVLNWTRISLEMVPSFNDWSDSYKLAFSWLHSHYLFSIWVSLRASAQEIAKFFAQVPYSYANPLDYLHSAYLLDIASPAQFNAVRFDVWGILNAIRQSGKIQLSSENQATLLEVLQIPNWDDLSRASVLWQNFDQAGDLLSSFLNVEIADMLDTHLAYDITWPDRGARLEAIHASLVELKQHAFALEEWRKLTHMLGWWPVYEDLKEDLQSLLLSIDIGALYRSSLELGHAVSQFLSLQLPYFRSFKCWEKSRQAVLDIARVLSEHEGDLKETRKGEKLDAFVLQCLVGPLLAVCLLAEDSYTETTVLVNQVVDICPFVIPLVRPIVEGIYIRTPAQSQVAYWPVLMKLRAQDVGKLSE